MTQSTATTTNTNDRSSTMQSKRYVYAVAPGGRMTLRESENKVYTHAVAVEWTESAVNNDPGWAVYSFHTSEALAQRAVEHLLRKGAEAAASEHAGMFKRVGNAQVVETIEVTAQEFRAMKRGKAKPETVAGVVAAKAEARAATQSKRGKADASPTEQHPGGPECPTCTGHVGVRHDAGCAWKQEHDTKAAVLRSNLAAARADAAAARAARTTERADTPERAQRRAERAARADVDVHDYVRGDAQRCATCGGARNIKAHTHIANKGA